jgi:hypothetical protein
MCNAFQFCRCEMNCQNEAPVIWLTILNSTPILPLSLPRLSSPSITPSQPLHSSMYYNIGWINSKNEKIKQPQRNCDNYTRGIVRTLLICQTWYDQERSAQCNRCWSSPKSEMKESEEDLPTMENKPETSPTASLDCSHQLWIWRRQTRARNEWLWKVQKCQWISWLQVMQSNTDDTWSSKMASKPSVWTCLEHGSGRWSPLYQQFKTDLENVGFQFNPYNPCIADRRWKGLPDSVNFQVDDLKSGHIDPKVNNTFLTWRIT